MRTAKIWIGTVHDHTDHREHDMVYVFPEGTTESQVLQELWGEWGNPDLPMPLLTWEAVQEMGGEDFSFEFSLRDVEVQP